MYLNIRHGRREGLGERKKEVEEENERRDDWKTNERN